MNTEKLEWKRTNEYSMSGTIVCKTVDEVWALHKDFQSGVITIFNWTNKKQFRLGHGVSEGWGTQRGAKCFLNGHLDFVTRKTM